MAQAKYFLLLFSYAVSLLLSLSACSITETINNILSSTSGRSWFTEDGLVKQDQKVNAFMALNFENVKQNMAQGRGEYLESLSTLMGIPPERRSAFFTKAQSRYSLVREQQNSPEDIIAILVGNEANAPGGSLQKFTVPRTPVLSD